MMKNIFNLMANLHLIFNSFLIFLFYPLYQIAFLIPKILLNYSFTMNKDRYEK